MHELQALIGSELSVAAVKQCWPVARSCELLHGLSIVPVDAVLCFQIVGFHFKFPDLEDDNVANNIKNHMRPLLDPLRRLASALPLALVCTQYSGGVGNQMAALLSDNRCSGPFLGLDAINQVLDHLGIRADQQNERDAFSVVGLERWRTTEELTHEAGANR